MALLVLYTAVALALAPLAQMPGTEVPAVMTALTLGLLLCDAFTASLLLAQFRESRARSLLPLVAGYLFTATMMLPQLLAFPGAVLPSVPILGNMQTAGWTWLFWHAGFPLWALWAIVLEARAPGRVVQGSPSRAAIVAVTGALVAGGTLAAVALIASAALPPLIVGRTWTPWNNGLVAAALALSASGAAIILTQRRLRANALFLWLAVALGAYAFDIALSVLGGARYSVGWFAGRGAALLSGTVLLCLLVGQLAEAYRMVAASLRGAVEESEAALVESGQMLRLALDAGDLGTWRWDVAKGTSGLEWDARCKVLFGMPADARPDYAAWAAAILEEDRAIAEEGVVRALDPVDLDDGYNCEYRVQHPDGTVLWLAAQGRALFEVDPALPTERRAVRITGTIADVTAKRSEEEKRARTAGLLAAFTQAVPGVIYAKDREGRILVANRGTAELVGKPLVDIIGCTDAEFLDDPIAGEAIARTDQRIMTSGVAEQVEETVRLADGTPTLWLSTKAPFYNVAGEVIGLIGSSVDITDRKRAEEARELLMREVDHRAKNALAVALSLVRLTPRIDASTFAAGVEGRIAAMARAHSLLAEEKWSGAMLRPLIEGELAAYPGRAQLSGPELRLRPETAQPLAMVLHELATNAAKHGALSGAGTIDLSWDIDEAGGLRLRWVEKGGPAVVAPTRRGFGSRLLASLAERQLAGQLALTWDQGGLLASLYLPPSATAYVGAAAALSASLPHSSGPIHHTAALQQGAK